MDQDDERLKLIELLNSTQQFVDENIEGYLKEAIVCFENRCNRSTIILVWNIFVYILYRKIENYGLSEIVKLASEKNFKFPGRINNIWDLNKFDDSKILTLAHEIGLFDQNLKNHLLIQSQVRNSCAHITQPNITEYKTFDFISEICDSIKVISKVKFDTIAPSFVERIKKAEKSELVELIKGMDFKKLIISIERIIEDLSLITTGEELRRNENISLFVADSVKSREDDNEKIIIFDLILNKVILGNFDSVVTRDFRKKLVDYVRFVCIKKHIISKKYLDSLIALFIQSTSFEDAKILSTVLLEFADYLTEEQVKTIAHASVNNSQIYSSWSAVGKLALIFTKNKQILDQNIIQELEEKLSITL